jgi:hypothetical protein
MSFDDLTNENIMMYAMKAYDRPNCIMSEFKDDLKRFNYLKRLFLRYRKYDEMREQLVINHLVVLYNVFGPEVATRMLFFKMSKEDYSALKTYLIFLSIMPDKVKGIKGHDAVYYDIQNDYPKKKWLEKNDYKFLPSVLDYYGIKSKYLIKELSQNVRQIQISTLNYFCKLFGNNHVDYLKKFTWESHCYETSPNKRLHYLKNESEKEYLIKVINQWETDTIKTDSLIYTLNKLFSIRDLLEQRGLELKFKAKNDIEFDNLIEKWNGFKLHFARGYKVKYIMPDNFVNEIEQDIVIDGLIFKPKILLTEDDFRIEGFNMKNCMSKQFAHGAIYIFVSLQHKRKRINLQYRKGKLIQSYGKANTSVIKIFENPTIILTERFEKHPTIIWRKDRYDFLTN